MTPTRKFRRMCEVYKLFVDTEHFDLSESALEEMFLHESFGESVDKKTNGYYIGKKWLNVTVDMWKKDIKDRLLFVFELYDSGDFPEWWLDSVFGGRTFPYYNFE